MSSTSMFILPVTKFNTLPIGDGEIGPTVQRLTDAFSGLVGVDIVDQAKLYQAEAEAMAAG